MSAEAKAAAALGVAALTLISVAKTRRGPSGHRASPEAVTAAVSAVMHADVVGRRWARAKAGVKSGVESKAALSAAWAAAIAEADAAVARARADHAANEDVPDWLAEASQLLESLHSEGPAPAPEKVDDAQNVTMNSVQKSAPPTRVVVAERTNSVRSADPIGQLTTEIGAGLVIILAAKELLRGLLY